ncbi:alpha/beta hydrolase family protein [Natranaerovirga pectinivora]|uniref:Alpha/beta hydrolase family protein n=1 Tax=Natranaerovirga pectinivora TaxID=682400 RepID=A0A4R3MQY8_9FIRM|nr:alpha/beta hydrolase family protein [Natranaerovirga pectinivora]TCT14988.1 alpha/beta hydrolase family protein [Natranaerovirga pectinivora]
MWAPDVYLEERYKMTKQSYGFNSSSISLWIDQKELLKEKLIELLGGFPEEKQSLNAIVIQKEEFEEYTIDRIEYSTYLHMRVPAYLIIPKNNQKTRPAVIACPGHGYGSKECIGLLPDGSFNKGDPTIHKNFALELVKNGFTVMVPEILGFGDRRLEEDQDKDPKENSCYRLATNLLMMGQTLIGHRVYETIRAMDYLNTRSDIIHSKIGCMGFSGGGLVTALTSAVDERIKATVISGYTNTFKDSIMAMRHCLDNYIPGIINCCEMSDLIGLIAPRDLFIESGVDDPIFPLKGAQTTVSKLKEIYNKYNADNNIEIDVFNGEHEVWGKKAYLWMKEKLYMV